MNGNNVPKWAQDLFSVSRVELVDLIVRLALEFGKSELRTHGSTNPSFRKIYQFLEVAMPVIRAHQDTESDCNDAPPPSRAKPPLH